MNAVLKDDTRGATGVRLGRFGRWLVVVEVAVSCVLLVVSGLMIRSIVSSSRMELSVRHARRVLRADEAGRTAVPGDPLTSRAPSSGSAPSSNACPAYGARRSRRARPGSSATERFVVDGAPAAPPETRPRAGRIVATPGYFEVLGAELRAGRLFTAADAAGAEPVAVVDEAFAARHLAPGGRARPASPVRRREGAVAHGHRRRDDRWYRTPAKAIGCSRPSTCRSRSRRIAASCCSRARPAIRWPLGRASGARRARLPGHAGRERELAGRRALGARLGRADSSAVCSCSSARRRSFWRPPASMA